MKRENIQALTEAAVRGKFVFLGTNLLSLGGVAQKQVHLCRAEEALVDTNDCLPSIGSSLSHDPNLLNSCALPPTQQDSSFSYILLDCLPLTSWTSESLRAFIRYV